MAHGRPSKEPPVVNVLVLGTSSDAPPPGLPERRTGARYWFANNATALGSALPETDVIFHWQDRTALLRAAWPAAQRLRWIHAAGVGVDWTIFPELVASDVILTNCRGVFDRSIPEYVLGLMLLFAKDFPGTLQAQRQRRWRHRPAEVLAGTHAVVVGAGSIGRSIARLLRLLGVQVTLVARHERPNDPEFGWIRASNDLAAAAAVADWLILALPLTPETRGLIGRDVLAALEPAARLINVGRGAVVDEAALIDALRPGRLAGAGLDVFEREPLPRNHPFWSLPGVVVSPHMAGDVHGWLAWFTNSFLANLERWLAGQPLANVVDKQLGYVPESDGSDRAGDAGRAIQIKPHRGQC